MKFVRALLIGLAPPIFYLAIAELCYLAWANAVETSVGWAGIFGGMILGLITMPAESLGASAFREFFLQHFGGSEAVKHQRAFVEAQADIWLMTLWVYVAAVLLCYLVMSAIPQKRNEGHP